MARPTLARIVLPSAQKSFTSVFGMGTGVKIRETQSFYPLVQGPIQFILG
ncbi:TPA: hypothetical protein SLL98_000554 [Bacillus cereus]|nr:hypothetical protein [Bacillus cereus]